MRFAVTSTRLLEALRERGNEGAWRDFCARYEPMLLAFARTAGLHEPDAQDVVQDVLLAFVEAYWAGKYDPARGRLRSWLKGIGVNKVRAMRRRGARREMQVSEGTDGTGFLTRIPDEAELTAEFENAWQQAVLADCLRAVQEQVEPRTFAAFRLYALEDWPPARVAAQLGMAPDEVYVCKSRVLAHLRKLHECLAEDW
jgi:RNA polymerase sigma-70 factor (ECF subfamily)